MTSHFGTIRALRMSPKQLKELVQERRDTTCLAGQRDRPRIYLELQDRIIHTCADEDFDVGAIEESTSGRLMMFVPSPCSRENLTVGEELFWRRHDTGMMWVRWYSVDHQRASEPQQTNIESHVKTVQGTATMQSVSHMKVGSWSENSNAAIRVEEISVEGVHISVWCGLREGDV